MKYLAIIFFSILAILWFYLSWFILKDFNIDIYQNSTDIITAILLAWVFTFWFLLAKLIYKNNSNNILIKEEIDEKILEKEFFLPQIDEEIDNNTYKNYDNDSELTKGSIDIILDEREENYKHKVNLKEEILKKDFEEIVEIKENKEKIIDNTFLNVSNNIKKKSKQDLKIIEWIWPKIEILLNNNWIYSYKNLENTEVGKLKNILKSKNKRYLKLHNPTTWPKQAKLANSWNFDELKNYQDKLVKWIEK